MPIYFGCHNMEKYFPRESYIQVDLNNKKEALEIIREAIREDRWSKNLEAIGESRRLILEKYQLFPYIENLVTDFLKEHPHPKKVKRIIRASGNSFWQEVKLKVRNGFK